MQEAHSIGRHSVALDGDIIRITYIGDYSGAGSFSTRTVLKMFVAAARVLLRLEPHFVFMATEAQASAWIHQHRARNS